MSSDYVWDISKQATERILQMPKSQREELLTFLDKLSDVRESAAISQFTDANSNMHHVAPFRNYAITYHVDHPVKRVHIIAIE